MESNDQRAGGGRARLTGGANEDAGQPVDVALLGAALATLPGVILLVDEGGRVLFRTEESSFVDHGDLRSPVAERAVLRSGTPMIERDVAHRRPDGSTTHVDILRTPLTLPEGPAAVLTVATDVSDRYEAEAERRSLEHVLHALVEAAPLGITVLDSDWRALRWNPEAERIFGWRSSEVVGRQPAPLHDDGHPELAEHRDEMERTGRSVRLESRRRRRDGAPIDLGLTLVPVRNGGAAVAATILLVEEVGERRRAEEQLRLRDRAIASVSNAILIVDARLDDSPIVSVNAAFERITGYAAAEVIGRNSRFLQGPGTDVSVTRELAAAQRQGRTCTATLLNYRKNGEPFWNELTISPVAGPHGEVTHFVGVMQDVSERRRSEETLQHLAYYDPVTDLPNRAMLRQRIQMEIAKARENPVSLALLTVDLRGFQELENLGQGVSDLVLQVVGSRLLGEFADGPVVARLRGDQFGILLHATQAEATSAGQRVLKVLERQVGIEELMLHVEGSVGIALFPAQTMDGQALILFSEAAAKEAEAAANGYAVYSAGAGRRSNDALSLLGELRSAIESEQLVLHYQPAVAVKSGRTEHVEALVRWAHPKRGLIMPGDFVTVAEQSSLIRPLTLWVVKAALTQVRAWLDDGLRIGVSVNLSARNLHDQRLVGNIASLLETLQIPTELLTFEITESALMADLVRSTDGLRRLKALGVDISIDDFGTGYSGFTYLRDDLIDEIKIDRSFVAGMTENANDLAIVKSLIHLGHELGLRVVAEGAETKKEQLMLVELGCDVIQGYYLGRPGPADAIGALYRRNAADGAA